MISDCGFWNNFNKFVLDDFVLHILEYYSSCVLGLANNDQVISIYLFSNK